MKTQELTKNEQKCSHNLDRQCLCTRNLILITLIISLNMLRFRSVLRPFSKMSKQLRGSEVQIENGVAYKTKNVYLLKAVWRSFVQLEGLMSSVLVWMKRMQQEQSMPGLHHTQGEENLENIYFKITSLYKFA